MIDQASAERRGRDANEIVDHRKARPSRVINCVTVESDYRAGELSLREMAAKHACSHSTIANRAAALGWTRPVHPR